MAEIPQAAGKPGTGRRQRARLIAIGVGIAVVLAFAIDNSQDIKLGFVLGDARAPLVVALLSVFALGAMVGWLFGRNRSRS